MIFKNFLIYVRFRKVLIDPTTFNDIFYMKGIICYIYIDFLKSQETRLEKKFEDLINKDKGNLENPEIKKILQEIRKEINQIKNIMIYYKTNFI